MAEGGDESRQQRCHSGHRKQAGWWRENYRRLWNERLDRLDRYLNELRQKEKSNGRSND